MTFLRPCLDSYYPCHIHLPPAPVAQLHQTLNVASAALDFVLCLSAFAGMDRRQTEPHAKKDVQQFDGDLLATGNFFFRSFGAQLATVGGLALETFGWSPESFGLWLGDRPTTFRVCIHFRWNSGDSEITPIRNRQHGRIILSNIAAHTRIQLRIPQRAPWSSCRH